MLALDLITYVWRHPLNASNRLAAVGRVAKWQLASRLLNGPFVVPFVDGTSLLLTRGMHGATGNYYCGLHEVRDMAFVLHVLRPGDHFLDVGANVGSYTVLAAGAAGARVTSVEPVPSTVADLRRNIALNDLSGRVTVVPCGLSETAGTLRFSSAAGPMNRVLPDAASAEPGVEVQVRTLDDMVGDDVPVVIKLDVEGHERAVLRGAARTLSDPRLLAIVIEINPTRRDVYARMVDSGFTPYAYDPFDRRLTHPGDADNNLVFVRDVPAVEARVRGARRYRLINGEI